MLSGRGKSVGTKNSFSALNRWGFGIQRRPPQPIIKPVGLRGVQFFLQSAFGLNSTSVLWSWHLRAMWGRASLKLVLVILQLRLNN